MMKMDYIKLKKKLIYFLMETSKFYYDITIEHDTEHTDKNTLLDQRLRKQLPWRTPSWKTLGITTSPSANST